MGTNYDVHIPGQEPLHLGKQSAGHPFTFRAEPEWGRHDGFPFRHWVTRACAGQIRDEYGNAISFQALLRIIIESQRYATNRPVGTFTDAGFFFQTGEFC